MCENGSAAVFLLSMFVLKCMHVIQYMITRMTLRGNDSHVLQPTAQITLVLLTQGIPLQSLTNTHIRPLVHQYFSSLSLSPLILNYILYPVSIAGKCYVALQAVFV